MLQSASYMKDYIPFIHVKYVNDIRDRVRSSKHGKTDEDKQDIPQMLVRFCDEEVFVTSNVIRIHGFYPFTLFDEFTAYFPIYNSENYD